MTLAYRTIHPKDEVLTNCILPMYDEVHDGVGIDLKNGILNGIYNEVNTSITSIRWTGIVASDIIKNYVQQA